MLEKVESTLDELGLHTMSELLSSQCEQSLARMAPCVGLPEIWSTPNVSRPP